MLKRTAPLIVLLLLFSAVAFSQISIEPIIGFQKDLNNKNLYTLNTALRFGIKTSAANEFLVQAQVSWPLSYHPKPDSAFTSNASLPLYVPARKTVQITSYSFGIGDRFLVAGWHTSGKLLIHFFTGVMYQRLGITYDYDKNNYVILNPDKTQGSTNLFISGGITYMRPLPLGRLLLELNLSSPPAKNAAKYPYKMQLLAPLSFNIGYSIPLSKKNHGK